MILSNSSTPRASVRPPPLWLVTNGDVTVGPINTQHLVHGFTLGRVPSSCYVRDTRNQAWRPVFSVREVRAVDDQLYKQREHGGAVPDETTSLEALVALSESTRETMLLGLHLAMRRTRSTCGLVHCFDDAGRPPITRVGEGALASEQLGQRLAEGDPLAHIAAAQRIGMGQPRSDLELRAAATRLAGSPDAVEGVAMVPVVSERGVIAMIELGRADHPFRVTDAVILREVTKLVASRLDVIS